MTPTPTPTERERALVSAFVRLADTLVADYDVIELLHALCADCVELLDVDAAGLLFGDQRGSLRLVSASTEAAQVVELFQLQADEGPCLDCYTAGSQVHVDVLAEETRWPPFVARARDLGFAAVHAIPLRLRGQTIGALNLFHRRPGGTPAATSPSRRPSPTWPRSPCSPDVTPGSARPSPSSSRPALRSRVIIEQAKGILAERGGIAVDEAFARLRSHARSARRGLSDLAAAVVDGTLDTTDLFT